MFPEVDSEMYCGEWRGSRGETFVGAVVKALEEEES